MSVRLNERLTYEDSVGNVGPPQKSNSGPILCRIDETSGPRIHRPYRDGACRHERGPEVSPIGADHRSHLHHVEGRQDPERPHGLLHELCDCGICAGVGNALWARDREAGDILPGRAMGIGRGKLRCV